MILFLDDISFTKKKISAYFLFVLTFELLYINDDLDLIPKSHLLSNVVLVTLLLFSNKNIYCGPIFSMFSFMTSSQSERLFT